MWEHFGDVKNYLEPFAGSLAVMLGRPDYDRALHTETINDMDAHISNFWRALQHDPDGVAYWADRPVYEVDLHAIHTYLINQTAEHQARIRIDPDYYDVKIAGWWVWGLSCWIGSGWCRTKSTKLPHVGDAGRGVNRFPQQVPHIGGTGKGINRVSQQIPYLRSQGQGVTKVEHQAVGIYEYMNALAERLRGARVCNGDWSRIMGPAVWGWASSTGVFLDPPYSHDERQDDLYATETDVADDVRAWCIDNGDNRLLRIALCGYDGEHEMPASWKKIQYKVAGGYGSQGNGRGRDNASRECVWFSPHCIGVSKPLQRSLLE